MPSVYSSAVIPADVETVWATIRDFNGLATWHPAIDKSQLTEGQGPAEIGSVRHLELSGGGTVTEKLLTLSDDDHSCTYCFTDPGDIPVRRYVSTIRLRPVTTAGHCFMEWSCDYDANQPGDEAGAAELFEKGVYEGGMKALQARFGS